MILVTLAGCTSKNNALPPAVIPAAGTLTYREQPVAEAQLTFRKEGAREAGFAQTDARGKFKCMTNDSDAGMPPGEYVVTVSRPRGGIPKKYAEAASSPLHVTVDKSGENEFALKLED